VNRAKFYTLFVGLSIAGYAWLGWNIAERAGSPAALPVCLFKQVTGLPCPSCGTTRAILEMIDGRIVDSLLVNPFGALAVAAMFIVPLWCIADLIRKSDSFYRAYGRGERLITQSRAISVLALAVVALNWLWNIAKGI
jgi:hypothetical protein